MLICAVKYIVCDEIRALVLGLLYECAIAAPACFQLEPNYPPISCQQKKQFRQPSVSAGRVRGDSSIWDKFG